MARDAKIARAAKFNGIDPMRMADTAITHAAPSAEAIRRELPGREKQIPGGLKSGKNSPYQRRFKGKLTFMKAPL